MHMIQRSALLYVALCISYQQQFTCCYIETTAVAVLLYYLKTNTCSATVYTCTVVLQSVLAH
jgi:hypothetical protein